MLTKFAFSDEVRSSGNHTPNTDLPSPPMSKESGYLSNHNSVLSNNGNIKNPVPSIRSNDQKCEFNFNFKYTCVSITHVSQKNTRVSNTLMINTSILLDTYI